MRPVLNEDGKVDGPKTLAFWAKWAVLWQVRKVPTGKLWRLYREEVDQPQLSDLKKGIKDYLKLVGLTPRDPEKLREDQN